LKVTAVAQPSSVSAPITAQVSHAVTAALQAVRTLGNDFIVNDNLWFAENDRGRLTPCVMNSAAFISKTFLGHLEGLGWTKEKELLDRGLPPNRHTTYWATFLIWTTFSSFVSATGRASS
jgi:hypothetical protein